MKQKHCYICYKNNTSFELCCFFKVIEFTRSIFKVTFNIFKLHLQIFSISFDVTSILRRQNLFYPSKNFAIFIIVLPCCDSSGWCFSNRLDNSIRTPWLLYLIHFEKIKSLIFSFYYHALVLSGSQQMRCKIFCLLKSFCLICSHLWIWIFLLGRHS